MATNNSVNTYITPTTANEVVMPSQPAFLAYLSAADLNETGDGTVFILGDTDVGTALTEVFDLNVDLTPGASGGAVFTASVTGRYFLKGKIYATGGTAINGGNSVLTTSNRDYRITVTALGETNYDFNHMVITDMDAADVARVQVNLTDAGGKVDDISGAGTNTQTHFSGYLAC